MTPSPATVEPEATIGEAWDLMRELDVRHLPVVQRGTLVGMLSDRDLAYLDLGRTLGAEGADAVRRELGRPVVEVMSSDVVSTEVEGELSDVVDLLLEHKIGAIPVIRPDTRELVASAIPPRRSSWADGGRRWPDGGIRVCGRAERGRRSHRVPRSLIGRGRGDVAMMIQELTRQESLDLLARIRLGRLACAHETQPYVVPIYFAYHNECLYGFSTVGQKIEWMRANPSVCVEADEVVSPEHWVTVLVFGRFEELPDTPEWGGARTVAHTLLKQSAVWWEPAYAKTILDGIQRPLVPVFYRIHCRRITGHRAVPEPVAPHGTGLSITDSGEHRWLRSLLRRVRGRLPGRVSRP